MGEMTDTSQGCDGQGEPETGRGERKRPREEAGVRSDLPEATRSKARDLLRRSLQAQEEGPSSPGAAAAERAAAAALEAAVLEAAPDAAGYRAKVRSLAAALRRGVLARESVLAGDLGAAELAGAGGEERLLTPAQREQRARARLESLERCLGTSLGGLGYYLMGIDCSGKGCHPECERRHLEKREQARGSWEPLQESRLIICAGPERSGSTWLYNAVRLLHLHARVPCDSYWLARLTEEKLLERLRARPPAVVCVKTHEWFPEYGALVGHARHILLTHRDLRGVCASYRRVKWALAIPDAYVAEHMEWRRRSSLDLAYEDIVRDGEQALRRLAEHLHLGVDDAMVAIVHRELLGLQRSHSGNAVCQVTKLWPDHVSIATRNMQGKIKAATDDLNVLKDPDYAQVLNTRFDEFQKFYGYI